MNARLPWHAPARRSTGVRTLRLTDKGLAAIKRSRPVEVPLLRVPWRDDRKDRKPTGGTGR